MDEKTRELVASNLTAAFYAGVERRVPYFGQEKRSIADSPMGDDRIPSLSPREVFHVYSCFLTMLSEAEYTHRG
jgi:hypothetical protein